MTTAVILIIDDSATIRKMVDSHLSQEGYRVLMAPTGEAGIQMARDEQPDLILLDHQLPGTTGIEVCRQIIAHPECQHIPFVVSSTLRKQAYIEYMDVPNVVDSLPKPFKPELLKMAVANALETGAMIIASQSDGTAVPEVVGGVDQPAFTGDLKWLGLREVIDFLTNGQKTGTLEVETEKNRIYFFLKDGRIQGVASPSLPPEKIAAELPASLKELAPLLQFTLSTGGPSQAAGLVELLDKKMLDPRMLRTLLRHQAASLTQHCFLNQPKAFSFLPERTPPSLLEKVSIDCSLAAILVDGCVNTSPDVMTAERSWNRKSHRGQNLDRTGLSAKHVQLLSSLDTTPKTTSELAAKVGLTKPETHSVLKGLQLAEWVESSDVTSRPTTATSSESLQLVVAFEPHSDSAATIRAAFDSSEGRFAGHVVRDELSFLLLLKRKSPQIAMIGLSGEDTLNIPLRVDLKPLLNAGCQVILIAPEESSIPVAEHLQGLPILHRPYDQTSVLRMFDANTASDSRDELGSHPEAEDALSAAISTVAAMQTETAGAHQ